MRALSDSVSVPDQDVLPEILFYFYIKKKKIHKDQPLKTTFGWDDIGCSGDRPNSTDACAHCVLQINILLYFSHIYIYIYYKLCVCVGV